MKTGKFCKRRVCRSRPRLEAGLLCNRSRVRIDLFRIVKIVIQLADCQRSHRLFANTSDIESGRAVNVQPPQVVVHFTAVEGIKPTNSVMGRFGFGSYRSNHRTRGDFHPGFPDREIREGMVFSKTPQQEGSLVANRHHFDSLSFRGLLLLSSRSERLLLPQRFSAFEKFVTDSRWLNEFWVNEFIFSAIEVLRYVKIVTVHGAVTSGGADWLLRSASTAAVSHWKTDRF